jgi:hypothetical protein
MLKQTLLYKRVSRMSKLDELRMFRIIFQNKEIERMIIDLNTIGQLMEGVNSQGEQLSDIGGAYSPITMELSRKKGRPKRSATTINLRDTGEFYRSFRVTVRDSEIVISANTRKPTGDLTNRWGDDILGLTDENKQKLINFAKVKYLQYLKRTIWG